MKRKTKRMGALLLSAAAAAALLMPLARADTRITDELTILFTHDTHSHFLLSDDGDGPTAAIPAWPPCWRSSGTRRRRRAGPA